MSEAVNLQERAQAYRENTKDIKKRIVVCAGTGCIAGGALKVIARFEEASQGQGSATWRWSSTSTRTAITCPAAAARAFARWGRW